jgi:nickel superoxide dismutase
LAEVTWSPENEKEEVMNGKLSILFVALAMVAATSSMGYAHCQIPCGIYDDPARFTELEEHVTTIEKSMNQILSLSKEAHPNWNQIVRWVVNKEDHADQLTEIVTFYFLAQRVKPADPKDKAASAKYVKQLTLLHHMIVHAMKAKQTTDLEHCEKLRGLIKEFKALYLGKQVAGASHSHGGHTHTHP